MSLPCIKHSFKKTHIIAIFVSPASIATHRDHFVRRPSVCLSVCLSVCHTFKSYVSQAAHAFLGMLPLFLLCRLRSIATHRDHFVCRLSVCLSVYLSVTLFCHTFQSYVSQATHAFLGMLPLFYCVHFTVWTTAVDDVSYSLMYCYGQSLGRIYFKLVNVIKRSMFNVNITYRI